MHRECVRPVGIAQPLSTRRRDCPCGSAISVELNTICTKRNGISSADHPRRPDSILLHTLWDVGGGGGWGDGVYGVRAARHQEVAATV